MISFGPRLPANAAESARSDYPLAEQMPNAPPPYNPAMSWFEDRPVLLHAGAARDAAGTDLRPATLLLRRERVEEVYEAPPSPATVDRGARVVELPEHLILPPLVNAHAHLDLTRIGPQPYVAAEGFVGFVRRVMAQRPREASDIIAWVEQGLELSRGAGVAAVGDIAGSRWALQALSPLPGADPAAELGVGYLECFGFENAACPEVASNAGLEPHAPYSAGIDLYRAAVRTGRRLCTHLAETRQEIEFVRHRRGPFVELLRELGKWSDSVSRSLGQDHPVDLLREVLIQGGPRWLLAHCNYLEDPHVQLLADAGVSLVYCPLASEYFGHTGHRYRDLLAAGVNVCLGTDSILCQPPASVTSPPAASQLLGLLPAMRRLHRRDGVAPQTLLAMATLHGARALQLEERRFTLPHARAGELLAVRFDPRDRTDALTQALAADAPAQLLRTLLRRSTGT